jgi:hypothetical protein
MDTPSSANKLLTDWANGGAAVDTLLDWLQGGEDLAVLGTETPPYFRILSAIPDQGDDQSTVREALAARAAELLNRKPDQAPETLGADGQATLANLLYLAAGLAMPKVLAHPLLQMEARRRLAGSWNTIPLENVLRDALIENQADAITLVPRWKNLVRTARPGFQTDAFDGFRGLVKATDRPGQPNLHNIAAGLRLLADYLDTYERDQRRPRFQHWSTYVDQCYSYRGELSGDEWVDMAKEAELPRWAAESLPRLIRISQTGSVVVWLPIVCCIPFPWTPVRPLCDGAALELKPSAEARDFILEVIPFFERTRREFLFDSPRAQLCMLNQIFIYLEDQWRKAKSGEFANLIHESRERLVREALADRANDRSEVEIFDRVCEALVEYARQRFLAARQRPEDWPALAQGAASLFTRPLGEVPTDRPKEWCDDVWPRAA